MLDVKAVTIRRIKLYTSTLRVKLFIRISCQRTVKVLAAQQGQPGDLADLLLQCVLNRADGCNVRVATPIVCYSRL